MESIYRMLTKQAQEISNMREGYFKNAVIQEFLFDVDGFLKDSEISYEERMSLYDLV